jgi:hypothetical protein
VTYSIGIYFNNQIEYICYFKKCKKYYIWIYRDLQCNCFTCIDLTIETKNGNKYIFPASITFSEIL